MRLIAIDGTDIALENSEELKEVFGRPRAAGGYEIIAGHRRKHASEAVGLDALPAIVRNIDDDAATILMVDSNIQRENILPRAKRPSRTG